MADDNDIGIPIAAKSALALTQNAFTAEQVTGTYQYLPRKGKLTLVARGSATGASVNIAVGGGVICSQYPIIFTGAAGGISTQDNKAVQVNVNAGKVEMNFFTTAAGSTMDYILYYKPM
jgi:ribosomal protein L21E